jgi:hypothetical protein
MQHRLDDDERRHFEADGYGLRTNVFSRAEVAAGPLPQGRSISCALIAFALAACATNGAGTPPARPIGQASLGRVGLATGLDEPTYTFDPLFGGKAESAATGAAAGALGGLQCLALPPPLNLLVIACVPIGTLVGTVAGASATAPSDAIDDAGVEARDALAPLRLNQSALRAGTDYAASVGLEISALDRSVAPAEAGDAPGYASLAATLDSVIEVSVLSVEAVSNSNRDVPIRFTIRAQVRLIDIRDGRVLDIYRPHYDTETRAASEWLTDSRAIEVALQKGVRDIVVRALDKVMIYFAPVHPNPSQEFALRLIDPPPPKKTIWPEGPFRALTQAICGDDYKGGHDAYGFERVLIRSLQPLFRWEPVPRNFDLVLGDGPGEAQRIRYDFRIYDATGVLYERVGLTEPMHVLEIRLGPCENYRWTVRARFVLDGAPRATEWTRNGNMGQWSLDVSDYVGMENGQDVFFPAIQTPSQDGASCNCR